MELHNALTICIFLIIVILTVLVSSVDYKHVGFASASEWVPAFDRYLLLTVVIVGIIVTIRAKVNIATCQDERDS